MCLAPDPPEMPKPSPPPARNAEALANPYPDDAPRGLSSLRVGNRSGKARAGGSAGGASTAPAGGGASSLQVGPGRATIPRAPSGPRSA